ncbi:MAG: Hint domain-containing protein [Rhodocyclaceae bacterium]|nr:Hint domain-containing protein [Rhodocyclaceae bacterium]
MHHSFLVKSASPEGPVLLEPTAKPWGISDNWLVRFGLNIFDRLLTSGHLAKAVMGELGKKLEADSNRTWGQVLVDIGLDEITVLLGGVPGAAGKQAAAKEINEPVNFTKGLLNNLPMLISPRNVTPLVVAGGLGGVAANAEASPFKSATNSVRAGTAKVAVSLPKKVANVVRLGDKELFKSPAPKSMTLLQGTQWYREQLTRIAKEKWIDPALPLQAQAEQAIRIFNLLQQGMRHALYSDALYPRFLEATRGKLPDKTSLKAARAEAKQTGEVLFRTLRDRYMKVDLPTLSYEPACFAGGTLVHTKNGLVPIEQIKVGDWVLSKHESGKGEREYKRVTNTFVHENRQVILVRCGGGRADFSYCSYDFVVTPEHPFWVKGKGWRAVEKLKRTHPRTDLEIVEGVLSYVGGKSRLFRTDDPDVAWVPWSDKSYYLQGVGTRYHVPTADLIEREVFIGIESVRRNGRVKPEHLYTSTVYNIEVEDFHTYYVGEAGVWVHNKNIVPLNSEWVAPYGRVQYGGTPCWQD